MSRSADCSSTRRSHTAFCKLYAVAPGTLLDRDINIVATTEISRSQVFRRPGLLGKDDVNAAIVNKDVEGWFIAGMRLAEFDTHARPSCQKLAPPVRVDGGRRCEPVQCFYRKCGFRVQMLRAPRGALVRTGLRRRGLHRVTLAATP